MLAPIANPQPTPIDIYKAKLLVAVPTAIPIPAPIANPSEILIARLVDLFSLNVLLIISFSFCKCIQKSLIVAVLCSLKGVCLITHFAYTFLYIPVYEKLQTFDSQGVKAGDPDHLSSVKIDHLKPELIP